MARGWGILLVEDGCPCQSHRLSWLERWKVEIALSPRSFSPGWLIVSLLASLCRLACLWTSWWCGCSAVPPDDRLVLFLGYYSFDGSRLLCLNEVELTKYLRLREQKWPLLVYFPSGCDYYDLQNLRLQARFSYLYMGQILIATALKIILKREFWLSLGDKFVVGVYYGLLLKFMQFDCSCFRTKLC